MPITRSKSTKEDLSESSTSLNEKCNTTIASDADEDKKSFPEHSGESKAMDTYKTSQNVDMEGDNDQNMDKNSNTSQNADMDGDDDQNMEKNNTNAHNMDGDNDQNMDNTSLNTDMDGGTYQNDNNISLNTDMEGDNDQNMDKKEDMQLKRIRQSENDEPNDVKDKFMLKISNFPSDWDFKKVHEFLLKEYGPVNVVYMAGDEDPCCVLEFPSYDDCKNAYDALHDKVVEDDKLIAEIRDSYTGDSDDEVSPPRKKKRTRKMWRPDMDIWEKDPRGLYGFKKEYLESLGIKLPIDRWVHVTNFRCDKHELKETLELAGEVLLCCVDNRGPKTANVMYSHPIEAVQAVSMLHNQPFYGQPLNITIQTCPPGTVFLPKGLSTVGPGLGCDGKPLRDIVRQFERFVKNKSSLINSDIFSINSLPQGNEADEVEPYVPKNISEMKDKTWGSQKELDKAQRNSSPTVLQRTASVSSSSNGSSCNNASGSTAPGSMGSSNPVKPHRKPPSPVRRPTPPFYNSGPRNSPVRQNVPNVGPSYRNTGVMGPKPVGPMPMAMGGNSRPMGPIRSPVFSNPMPMGPRPVGPIGPNSGLISPRPMGGPTFGPGPRPGFNGPRNLGPMNMPMGGPVGPMGSMGHPPVENDVTVELSNLPLSTTFPLLCEKMAECGQVMSIQLTSPGCAVVQFAHVMQAEKCFEQYHNCVILGNVIKVKFL